MMTLMEQVYNLFHIALRFDTNSLELNTWFTYILPCINPGFNDASQENTFLFDGVSFE